MKHPSIIACAAVLLAAGASTPAMAQSEAETEVQIEVPSPPGEDATTKVVGGATLYRRLGGYDVIAQTVDDFLERLGEDERLQRFVAGQSDSTMRSIRQHTVDFLCEKTGGPCFYSGRDMDAAHEATGITGADWERATELMAASLDARGFQGELRDEIGGFIAGLRDDIVDEE